VTGDSFIVDAPTRRPDIQTYQDLIEEVVRIHGYHVIPTTLPRVPSTGFLTPKQMTRRLIRNTLSYLGLDETVTYSLVTPEKAVEFDLEEKPIVRVSYPMTEERSTLRHSLIPSMLDVATYNYSRKTERITLFEMGKGYTVGKETEYVSGVISGTFQESLWQGKEEKVDFFLVKGLLEALFERLGIQKATYEKMSTPSAMLHPGISALIKKGNLTLGIIGKLHPTVQIAKGLEDTFVFELDFEALVQAATPNDKMQEVAKFPAVMRDIAIVVDHFVTADQILERVQKAGKKALVNTKIFDVYQGDKIDPDKKSVALSLVFQDYSKTLETAEIDQITNRIVKSLETELKATLRS
jgi:phenylalanyl-tRNA synthetase beta chain